VNNPKAILKLWTKLADKHKVDTEKAKGALPKKGEEHKTTVKKGLTALRDRAVKYVADSRDEGKKVALVKTRDRSAGALRKYCRYLTDNKKGEAPTTFEKHLRSVKKLTAIVLKLQPNNLVMSDEEVSLDNGLTNAVIDIGAVEDQLSGKDTDPETFDFDEEEPQSGTAPTSTKLRDEVRALEDRYRVAVARKGTNVQALTAAYEALHGPFDRGEYDKAEPFVAPLKKLLDEADEALKKQPTARSSTGEAEAARRYFDLNERFLKKVQEPGDHTALRQQHALATGLLKAKDLDKLSDALDELEKTLKLGAAATPAQKLEYQLFSNRVKALESQLPALRKDLGESYPKALDTKLQAAKLKGEKLEFKDGVAALIEAEKLLTAARALRQTRVRPEQARKDLANANKYLDSAKDLNVNQALEHRLKLVQLRNDSRNIFGALQEAPLDDPRRRRQVYEDRLSQSGTTMAEHMGLARFIPDKVKELITFHTDEAGKAAKKLATDLKGKFANLKGKDDDDERRLTAIRLAIKTFLTKSPVGVKDVQEFHDKVLSKLGSDPADLAAMEESLDAVARFEKIDKGLAAAKRRTVELPPNRDTANQQSAAKFKGMLDGTETTWKQHRLNEINATIERQRKEIERLDGLKSPDAEQARKDLEALERDKNTIQETLDNFPGALAKFKGEFKGRWGEAKKKAKTDPEAAKAMKAARWMRQELMNDALENTAVAFLQKSAKGMGISEEDLKQLKIEELPPSDNPRGDSAYLDSRMRRYQLTVPENLKDKYGPTLTVGFIAPGSTEDTSDIDMQFVCEENPTACSELIRTFQETSRERLDMLKDSLGEGSLAQIFDTNPYPAGFVFRPELGSDLHFSDTYTERSMEAKKTLDAGLSLIRRLETPATDEEGNDIDPIEQILAANTNSDMVARDRQLRSLRVGVDVSLKSQYDRLTTLLGEIQAAPGGAEKEHAKLKELLKAADLVKQAAPWEPGSSLTEKPLEKDDLKKRHTLSNEIAEALHEFAEAMNKAKPGSGDAAVGKARNEVYLKALEQVETLTRARDLALVEGGGKVAALEKRIAETGAKREDVVHQDLFRQYDEALEEVRSATSTIAVQAFVAQGLALNNADEAYTSRGAIGHVVEEQMGRQFVKTTGSAFSNLESNAGFILEHFSHDTHGDGKPKSEEEAKKELAKFAMATGKYIERMAKAMETLDSHAVNPPKPPKGDGKPPSGDKTTPPTEKTPREKAGKCPPGTYAWIKQLGVKLSFLKKGRNPDGKGFLADPQNTMEPTILECLRQANIGSLKQLEMKLEEVTNYAFQVNAQED
jgi:hypothetical protein